MKKGIGFRIITMAVIISIIAAFVGCIGLLTTKRVSKIASDMYNKSVLRVQYAGDIRYSLQSGAVILLNASLPGKSAEEIKDFKNQFSAGYASFEEGLRKYESTNIDAQDKKDLIQRIRETGKEYVDKGNVLFDYLLRGDLAEANKYSESILVPLRNKSLNPAVEQLVGMQVQDAASSYEQSVADSSSALFFIILTIVAGFVLSLVLGITITRSITKPVSKMVQKLSESSGQIAISSSQLSSASQEIANGAQEQAASIEETTSSMEELSSMVRQNLDNTRQASLLAQKADDASEEGSEKMNEMLTAMNSISKSAEDIKNVIDVIDDISFQTNMLALNAAVEAARAGEAGMGFAVVAEEVKNLANRSSQSAKETAAMIKETLKNVDEGLKLSNELSDIFKNDRINSKKVMEMNREVETASTQQDEGIGQVNKALVQFDTVVQTNASSAEETAGAAEELQGQVSSLNDIVVSLHEIVNGNAASGQKIDDGATVIKDVKKSEPVQEHCSMVSAEKGNVPHETAGAEHQKTGSHTISFENDEDFKPV